MDRSTEGFRSIKQIENYVKSIQWDKRLKREIPFISKLFNQHGYRMILDLGCGPGLHASELAKMDFDVRGLDVQPNMISYAKENIVRTNLKLNFTVGNFLEDETSLGGPMDAIYSLGNAIMIIWSQGVISIQEIFNRLAGALKPGGGLFFQILNSNNPRQGYVVSKISRDEALQMNQILIKHFLPVKNNLHTHFMTLKWKDGEINILQEENEPGTLLLVTLGELEGILTKAGFINLEFYEDYFGNPLKVDESDSLICFAIKK